MGEELRVPWHTFGSCDPIIASLMGGILLSLMVRLQNRDWADVCYLTTEVV